MNERQFFDLFLYAWVGLAAITGISLHFVPAPYGRHQRSGWGPRMNATAGWILMEIISPLGMAFYFAAGDRQHNLPARVFLALWLVHYGYRALVFPFCRRGGTREIPFVIVLLAAAFNLGNSYLNGRWLFHFGPPLAASWFGDPRFLGGTALFAAGFLIHLHADRTLIRLRKPGDSGYSIPTGGLYQRVSCPNYFGEIVEWTGFALATWSAPAAAFALWTAANLVPRALAHHRWYRATFPNYPANRRALVPYLL